MNKHLGKVESDQEESLKSVVCSSCDGFCPVAAKVQDGRVVKEYDDLMSATRYALMMLRFARVSAAQRRPRQARATWRVLDG